MKAYFIGIGGIGMSALARHYKKKGWTVIGYDRTSTELTRKLESENLTIFYTEDLGDVPLDADLYVRTAAISEEFKITAHLRKHGKKVLKRSELLGALSKAYRTIAVAGTHGKTSTSGLIAHCMKRAGMDPTAFIGGILSGYQSNYMSGDGDWLIVEADEYDRSFLSLEPEIVLWTAMDPDHLDIYTDQESMKQSYHDFIDGMREDGLLIRNESIEPVDRDALRQMVYGWHGDYTLQKEGADWILDLDGEQMKLSWRQPGEYNAMNALGASAVLKNIGMPIADIKNGLESFAGIARRYERLGENEEYTLIMDYAHHPVEVRSVLEAARSEYGDKPIHVVFQPHLYSRTRDFARDFAEALDLADEVWVTEIYPAREDPIPGVTAAMITDAMKTSCVKNVETRDIENTIDQMPPGVLMILGAGDLDQKIEKIKKQLKIK